MQSNPALDQYINELIEQVYGDELDDDAKHEARLDMTKAFNQLFNTRLVDKFSDEQLDAVEKLAAENRVDEITKFAYNNGINLNLLMAEVMQEFQQLYAPGLNQKPNQ